MPLVLPRSLHHDLAVLLRHAAVVTRDAKGIETRVAGRMTPHDDHGAIQRDIWTFIEGHQSNGHGDTSSIDAAGGTTFIPVRQG